MRAGEKQNKAPCHVCGHKAVAITKAGTLRKHPLGAEEPCAGTGFVVAAPENRATPPAPQSPDTVTEGKRVTLVPGIYATTEKMLDGDTPIPPGFATVSITALIPYDGSNGRTPREEAARLFEDPAYLDKVLCAVPNRHFRLLLKITAPPTDR